MEALMERLTTTEAAVAPGVSVPQIHRIIDKRILPEDMYSTEQMRTFRTDASVLIAFYFETAEQINRSGQAADDSKRNGSLFRLGHNGRTASLKTISSQFASTISGKAWIPAFISS